MALGNARHHRQGRSVVQEKPDFATAGSSSSSNSNREGARETDDRKRLELEMEAELIRKMLAAKERELAELDRTRRS